ncbi:MAG: DMT family transporter [Rhodospirillales bacterium]|nr:DMT family transporter [Rhodospirillales bacterium]
MDRREWAQLLALAVLWSWSFFFVALAVGDLPPLTIVFARVAIAAAALGVYARAIGHSFPRDPAMWANFAALGLLNNVIPFGLIVWGQTHIASGLASILNATTPLFAIALAHFFTRDERMNARKFIGVAVGIGGVAVLIGPEAVSGLGVDLWAQIAILGAAISYSAAGIFGRRLKGQPPVVSAAGQLSASTLIMLPLVLVVDQPWTLAMPGPAAIISIVALALLSTALAYAIYFRLLATAGATNLLLVTFLIPVGALLLGTLALGERLAAHNFAGMGLVFVGLAIIDGRLIAAMRARAA